jgi:hypothetical protein
MAGGTNTSNNNGNNVVFTMGLFESSPRTGAGGQLARRPGVGNVDEAAPHMRRPASPDKREARVPSGFPAPQAWIRIGTVIGVVESATGEAPGAFGKSA